MRLYCEPCNKVEDIPEADMEALVYVLVGCAMDRQEFIPCLSEAKDWANDAEMYAEYVNECQAARERLAVARGDQ